MLDIEEVTQPSMPCMLCPAPEYELQQLLLGCILGEALGSTSVGSPVAATLMPRGKKLAASPGVRRPTPSPAKPAKGFFDKPARSTPAVREIVCPSAMRVISSDSESHIESALGIYRREKSKLAKTMAAQTSNAKSTRASKRQKVTREPEPGSAGPPSSQSFDRASGDAAGDL